MTDKELEKIYNEAYRAVYWTAMSLLKNEADAEDIVQDTFVTLIESYDTLNDKDKVIPWLKKIAANKCLNRLARTKTDAVEDEFFDDVEAIAEDFLPDSIVESEEARKIVMDIINNKLSDDIRRTLILFYFDDLSTKEIAEALGVPEGTVRRRLNFARNKIKKEVEKYEEENDTKLFGMAIPFLTKLFIKESEQVAIKPMPASLANLSASAEASGKGVNIKASTEAIKKGTDIMKTKILIGSIAAVVAVGVTVGIIAGIASKSGKAKGSKIEDAPTEEAGYSGNDTDHYDYTEPEETEESSKTVREAGPDSIIVDMTGMSVDDVVNNIKKMRDITEGTKASSIDERFYYDEEQMKPEYYEEVPFNWSFYPWDRDKTDTYLLRMDVSSFARKDDTYYYHEEAYTDVTLTVKDEQRARDIFQAAVDWLSTEYEITDDITADDGRRVVKFSNGKYIFSMSCFSFVGEYTVHIQLPIKP